MPVLHPLILITLLHAAAGPPIPPKNPDAVAEVLAGKRTEANAAWWGFDVDDSTEALQAAIKSGAKRVVVPNLKRDWIVRPIQLAGDQELVFEDGVVVAAKRGEYRGGGDTVFTATKVKDLTIRGRGATIRMNKEDYIYGLVLKNLNWQRGFGQYPKAEWRSVLALRGCTNVEVTGLTLRDSGGDGIYIDRADAKTPCREIRIKNVVCDNNYRQGMSVIGVEGLTVEDCAFRNTWGTPPSAGVDLEPDSPEHTLKRIVFRNCRFEDNYSDGILIFLSLQKSTSAEVSIRFEHCHVSSRFGSGIRVARAHDDGPRGLIEFHDSTVENTQAYGIKVQDKGVDRARVRFVGCRLRNVARDRNYQGAWVPIWLHSLEPDLVKRLGGIDFVDCTVEDDRDRPAIELTETKPGGGLFDVTGTVRALIPGAVSAKLGELLHGVTLRVEPAAGFPR
jgi:hypothetical protein